MNIAASIIQQKITIGRFAPSPTGLLHFGSLIAAVGSYLDARSNHGRWLLRIEDVDRIRTVPGMVEGQIAALSAYGFEWDGPVYRQSARDIIYRETLDRLVAMGLAYPCTCTRSQIAAAISVRTGIDGAPIYPGHCRGWQTGDPVPANAAWRFRVPGAESGVISFVDMVQGRCTQNLQVDIGDFVLLRADGCFTYQLAVVVDDMLQNVTHVVRGADLIDSVPRQIALISALGGDEPVYAHLPVVVNGNGEKLSKQTRAPVIPVDREPDRVGMLWQALSFLGQNPEESLRRVSQGALWSWALANWSLSQVPRYRQHAVPMHLV